MKKKILFSALIAGALAVSTSFAQTKAPEVRRVVTGAIELERAEKRIRSTMAPEINAAVMIAKVPW